MANTTLVLLAAGSLGVVLGGLMTFNARFAAHYVRHSPKAWVWRKLLGEERAIRAMQTVFGPLGMCVGAALIATAIWLRIHN